jgi:hypothetical protein
VARMKNRSSTAVNQGFKETNLIAAKDSSISLKKEKTTFRQFIIKFADIVIFLFLGAYMISLFMEPLFRGLLLAWLRSILENN